MTLNTSIRVVLFAALLLFWLTPALAYRPFLTTESAEPVGRGLNRFEIGLTYNRDSPNSHTTLLGELTAGLLHNLDVEVEFPYHFLRVNDARNEDGLGDVTLKSKFRFVKGREEEPLSLSGQMIVKFPLCDEDKGLALDCTGEPDVGLLGMATKTFYPVTAHLNLGYLFVGNPPGQSLDDVVSYSLGLEHPYEGFTFIGELTGRTHPDPSAESDLLSLLAGTRYHAEEHQAVDLAVGAGLTKESPDFILTVGFTTEF